MLINAESKEWRWFLYFKSIKSKYRLEYNRDNYDLSEKWAKDHFHLASAKAWVTNSKEEKFEAKAEDFSHGEPDEWVCKDDKGNDNHEDDETCIVCD